jgi:hypothetical protein
MPATPVRLEIRKGEPVEVDFACGPRSLRFSICRRDVGDDGGHTVALVGPLGGARPGAEEAVEPPEILRFDLFRRDPHYHVPSSEPKQIDIDRARDGDAVEFALAAIGTRLGDLIDRAGHSELAASLDPASLAGLAERVRAAVAAAPEPTTSYWIELPMPPAQPVGPR